jgi:hypothetical protein
MSSVELHLMREHAEAGKTVTRTLPPPQPQAADVKARESSRQPHQERLARLFRHVGSGADDRYLMDIMGRYRGIKAS